MQQTKYQEEYMQQAKCYPCNEPSVVNHEEYMQHVSRRIHAANQVLPMH
jgi:hypothetical protein